MTGIVRVVYLVSKDSSENTTYRNAIWNAMIEVREWYRTQLGGKRSFFLNKMEVIKASQSSAYISGKDNSWSTWFASWLDWFNLCDKDNLHFDRALAEVGAQLGARQNDSRNCWVIYSDAPGNKGRGGAGVCMLPGDDLLGLTGTHPKQKSKARWIGGLAHELGHAMGLPHPKDTEADANAIMWGGFYDHYPNGAYLTDDDKRHLLWTCPYIQP